MQSQAKPPRPPRRTESHDDLEAVVALDAAEARLRAAKLLADEEAKRADEIEERNQELERALATLKTVTTPETVPKPDKPISLGPQALTLRGSRWKVTIPIAALIAIGPLIWTLVSDYLELKRQVKTQTTSYEAINKRIDELETYAHEVGKSNAELRETVAQISGYLAGVLPKAGVKVPAEPGAAFVNIESDPPPIGYKKQKPIVVHTPVPAPAPKY